MSQAIRVLCIRRREILVVSDEGALTLPRGDVLATETCEQAAAKLLLGRFGLRPRVLRRVQSTARGLAGDWLVFAETDSELGPDATACAFAPFTADRPLGPLDLTLWGALASVISNASSLSLWIARAPSHRRAA